MDLGTVEYDDENRLDMDSDGISSKKSPISLSSMVEFSPEDKE